MAIQVDLITSLRHEAGMENLPLEINCFPLPCHVLQTWRDV